MEAKEEQKQLSYEELQQAANALAEENERLKANFSQALTRLKECSDFAAFKRLDYLFKVVESKDCFHSDFFNTCIDEIEASIYPEQEEPKQEQK